MIRKTTTELLTVGRWICVMSALSSGLAEGQESRGWATSTGGSGNGFAMPWQSRAFTWSLPLADGELTGSLDINRTGAGLAYAGFESHAQTLIAHGVKSPVDYDSLPAGDVFANLGLSSSHFVSEGENPSRGAIDDSPLLTRSLTNYSFQISGNLDAMSGFFISLFDVGMAESSGSTTSRGPTTYTFSASMGGAPVTTDDWVLHIGDPYAPHGNSDTTSVWNAGTGVLEVNNYTIDLGVNFPDNLLLLETGASSFDALTITVDSLASELIGIGLSAPFLTIPEPGTTALLLLPLVFITRRSRGSDL